MSPQISSGTFDAVFGWAPFVAVVIIFFVFYFAKRRETSGGPVPIGQTYACAGCGRRGAREHMVPQEHLGAVGWYCSHCATQAAAL